MISIDPNEVPTARLQSLMQSVVAPRPIALASTVDVDGNINLSPFSFFNMFGTRPPILVFSPSRRVRNGTKKHTLENVLELTEVVINTVSFSMVEQVSLASVEFPKGVNEFVKSGLTPIASVRVKPPRVKESAASFECSVRQVVPLGSEGGAGNLVICEVLLAHFKEDIFHPDGTIDPDKVDAVARMGMDYYCRASGESVFVVPKPNSRPAIGYDAIPAPVRESKILTGNDLGRLGNMESLPTLADIERFTEQAEGKSAMSQNEDEVHRLVQRMLQSGRVSEAWMLILAYYKEVGR